MSAGRAATIAFVSYLSPQGGERVGARRSLKPYVGRTRGNNRVRVVLGVLQAEGVMVPVDRPGTKSVHCAEAGLTLATQLGQLPE